MNIYIETYGCSANQNNSEIMAGLLSRAGHMVVNNAQLADINVLNSCIVKGPTLQKMLSRIKELKNKRLIVAGCMPDVMAKEILGIAPKASLVGSHHVNEIVKALKAITEGNQVCLISKKEEERLCKPKVYKNPIAGITQISEGCLGNCSYCIVKLSKGHLNSYSEENILKSIALDLQSGCKEIWLTSQDCAAYGKDKRTSIVALLKKVLAIKGNFFVRLGMSNPDHVLPLLDEIIEIYKHKKMFKFLHIPVQSGSNKVLKDMTRGYKKEDFIKIVETFKKEIPEMTISTDIIAGFPTETDEDFNETMEMLKSTRPSIINISRYWPMPYTRALFHGQLKPNIIMQRTAALMGLHNEIALSKNKEWIGWKGKAIIDEKSFDDFFIARNLSYKPIVLNANKKLLGKTVDVKITDANSHNLIGQLLINSDAKQE